MSAFSERLTNLRQSLHITKAEAARRLNMSAMGYGRYESGERMPSFQTISYIAQVFGTTYEYLTGGSDRAESDTIHIAQQDDPELFRIAQTLQQSDNPALKARILAYLEQLSKQPL